MAAGDVEVNITTNNSKACAVFDGVDDEMSMDAAELHSNRDFTLSLWFKAIFDGGSEDSCLFSFRPTSLRGIGLEHNEGVGKIGFKMRNNAGTMIIQSTTITNNTWLHVCATYNVTSNIAKLYINGTQEGGDGTGILTLTSVATTVGGNNIISGTDQYFKGAISDVRLYDGKELSAEEVLKISNNQDLREGLTNRWKLDKDYTDSVGSTDGTNSGSRLSIVDDTISAAVAADRTTANDNYIAAGLSTGQVVSGIIEEA